MSQGFTKGTPIDTDPTLSLNSDIVVPSQKAVKAYVASQVGTPVSGVTASSPILSSGGLTPNISIPAATSLVDGYLTSTDWTNFNTAYTNRITSLTTTGSSGAATLSGNVLNIPNYTLSGLGGQPQLNGTGFVKATGTTISYDNTTYAPLASPAFTGTPTAPTAAEGTNTTQIATTEFVTRAIATNGISTLDKVITPVSVVNTTTNTLVYSYRIPANFLNTGDILTVFANTNSNTTNGNSQAARYYINTSASLSGATLLGTLTNTVGTSDFYGFTRQFYVTSVGASGNIKFYPTTTTSSVGFSNANVNQDILSLTIDTTVDQYLILGMQMGAATFTCSLQTLYLELRG